MNDFATATSAASGPVKKLDSLWVYALLALVATAGFFYVNLMAAIVDGLVAGLGFTNAQAGTVGSANIYGATAGALIAVFLVGRLRWKPAVAIMLVALIGIDLGSTLIRTPWLMIGVRGLDGVIGGMATGLIYAVMARTFSPDRAFGALLVVFMGNRFGRLKPLLVAMLLTLIGTVGFYWSTNDAIYFIANVGTGITWSFVVSYLFGMVEHGPQRPHDVTGWFHLAFRSGHRAAGCGTAAWR